MGETSTTCDAPPALIQLFPKLEQTLPVVRLGEWPTPIEHHPALGKDVWIKREDLASPIYGGNKIRTLEMLFGAARERGAERIWAIGGYGSNHALATARHAARAGLKAGALLFPQHPTPDAAESFEALLASDAELRALRTVLTLPLHAARLRLGRKGNFVMSPGGATPVGALGHVSAALEMALQIQHGLAPEPKHIVVAMGSCCTVAGLLEGLLIAQEKGIGFTELPTVHAIRVVPWPISTGGKARRLAHRMRLYCLNSDFGIVRLRSGPGRYDNLKVHGGHIGRGYGRPTEDGHAAIQHFEQANAPALDTTYTGKSAAALLKLADVLEGPLLYWHTRNTALLPDHNLDYDSLPRHVRRWLKRAKSGLTPEDRGRSAGQSNGQSGDDCQGA